MWKDALQALHGPSSISSVFRSYERAIGTWLHGDPVRTSQQQVPCSAYGYRKDSSGQDQLCGLCICTTFVGTSSTGFRKGFGQHSVVCVDILQRRSRRHKGGQLKSMSPMWTTREVDDIPMLIYIIQMCKCNQ